ncbi:hypothetical protein ABPG72_001234 [Tetrahymena utriculariae]
MIQLEKLYGGSDELSEVAKQKKLIKKIDWQYWDENALKVKAIMLKENPSNVQVEKVANERILNIEINGGVLKQPQNGNKGNQNQIKQIIGTASKKALRQQLIINQPNIKMTTRQQKQQDSQEKDYRTTIDKHSHASQQVHQQEHQKTKQHGTFILIKAYYYNIIVFSPKKVNTFGYFHMYVLNCNNKKKIKQTSVEQIPQNQSKISIHYSIFLNLK